MLDLIKSQLSEQRWLIIGAIVFAIIWYAIVVRPSEKKLYSIIECTQDGSPEEFNRCSKISI